MNKSIGFTGLDTMGHGMAMAALDIVPRMASQ
jgi:hypothetical protein